MLLSSSITSNASNPVYEFELSAPFRHQMFLFCERRYKPGGHFSPHTDGYTIWDFNRRSFYSCLLYLNTCGGGGATRMLKCNEDDAEFVTDHGVRIPTRGRRRIWVVMGEIFTQTVFLNSLLKHHFLECTVLLVAHDCWRGGIGGMKSGRLFLTRVIVVTCIDSSSCVASGKIFSHANMDAVRMREL